MSRKVILWLLLMLGKQVAHSVELVFLEIINALRKIKDKGPMTTGSLDGNEKLIESWRNIADLQMLLHSEKAEFEVKFLFLLFIFYHHYRYEVKYISNMQNLITFLFLKKELT